MKLFYRFAVFVFGMAVLFVLGFAWRDLEGGHLPSGDSLKSMLGVSTVGQKSVSAPELFHQTYKRILTDYYRKVNADQLEYAGMEGLMGSLGDPHTSFLDPKANDAFKLETTGNFVGVGARLSPDPLGAKVVSVFENGPAHRAGLKAGDTITAVDQKRVSGTQIDAIVSHIRGQEGTTVRLTVVRLGSAHPLTIAIRRAQVTTPTVESRVLEGTKIGYMSVAMFAEPTTEQFDDAIGKLEKSGITGLIIDLRSNPGGLLETAVDMLSRFVEDKVVIKMKMRGGEERVQKTVPGYLHAFHYPIAVLVNEDSASAAEIFSGVLRDYKLATLVGEHTYGKASVQEVTRLIDQASAKITVARYFLPSGQDIGRRVDEDGQYISGGIDPDVKVDLDLDKVTTFGDMKTDNQLQRAVEVIKSKM